MKRIVGGNLRVWYARARRTSKRRLIVEVELEVPLVGLGVLLDLEAVAHARQAWSVCIIFSRGVFEQLLLRCEILKLELRICRVFSILSCYEFVQNLTARNAALLPRDELLQVILHHIGRLVPLANHGDDRHFNLGQLEALHFQTVRGDHIKRASDIFKQIVVSAGRRVVPIREEIVQVFLSLALLDQRGRPGTVWRLLSCITIPGETGYDWHLELGDELLVRHGGRVNVVPHEDHDKHG